MIEKEWKKVDLESLELVANECMQLLNKPCCVIFTGPVGAGKTTLIKAMLGERSTMSPTYTFVVEGYDFVHADFYRLEDPSELMNLELDLYLEGKNYFFCEWGREYLGEIERYLSPEYSVYELIIDIISPDFRNIILKNLTNS